MRSIKFRVWNKKRKSYNNDHKYDVGGDNDIVEYFASPADCFLQSLADCLDDDNIILEQFTGLTDSKGKDIYEGDIVKYGNTTYSVAFTDECYGGKSGWDLLDKNGVCHNFYYGGFETCGSEVIGNINENPELI